MKEVEYIQLEPLSGDQAACGEWVDLGIDQVYPSGTLKKYSNRAGF